MSREIFRFFFVSSLHFCEPTNGRAGLSPGVPASPLSLILVIFVTVYGCQGRARFWRGGEKVLCFSRISLRAPLTAVDRYGNWLEKGKGALSCSPSPVPGSLPLLVSFLRRIANRSVPCRDLSSALPTYDLRHLFLPSFHTHCRRRYGLRAG